MTSLHNCVCPLFELFSHNYINKKKSKLCSLINSGLKGKVCMLIHIYTKPIRSTDRLF